MLPRLTLLGIVFCLVLTAATKPAQDKAPATAPAEVQQLKGKIVQIYHHVDLTGAGKPSPLHTGYLAMVLQQAGATLIRPDEAGKKPDVVIFGEMLPPPQLTPDEAADPFLAARAKNLRQAAETYQQSRPRLEQDAAAAGARVIRSADVATALGIHVTEAQMVEALNAQTRESLQRVIPTLKADRLSLADIIDFLRDVSGANIYVNWRALEAVGVDRKAPVTLDLREVPLSEALDKLLAQAAGKNAKLGYAVREGVIEVSTVDDVKKAAR
jgi:hypothetical protein